MKTDAMNMPALSERALRFLVAVSSDHQTLLPYHVEKQLYCAGLGYYESCRERNSSGKICSVRRLVLSHKGKHLVQCLRIRDGIEAGEIRSVKGFGIIDGGKPMVESCRIRGSQ
jgi:hypothetical protein